MIRVFHSKDMHKSMRGQYNDEQLLRMLDAGDGFEFVASVDTDDLEEAYRLTNHIDSNWMRNPGVAAFVNQARSTSVGDLLASSDGVYVVSSVGFRQIRKIDPVSSNSPGPAPA